MCPLSSQAQSELLQGPWRPIRVKTCRVCQIIRGLDTISGLGRALLVGSQWKIGRGLSPLTHPQEVYRQRFSTQQVQRFGQNLPVHPTKGFQPKYLEILQKSEGLCRYCVRYCVRYCRSFPDRLNRNPWFSRAPCSTKQVGELHSTSSWILWSVV